MVNREKIVAKLEAAEAEVGKLRDLLQLYDLIAQEEVGCKTDKEPKTQHKNDGQKKPRDMELGRMVRKTFLDVGVNDLIDTPKVIKIVQSECPNRSYDVLGRLVGGIARKLVNRGELQIEIKGSGRTPNTYKRILKKRED